MRRTAIRAYWLPHAINSDHRRYFDRSQPVGHRAKADSAGSTAIDPLPSSVNDGYRELQSAVGNASRLSRPRCHYLRRAHRGCRCLVPSACLSGAGPRYKASERLRYVLMAAPSASANTSAVPAPFPFIANYQLALASRRRSDHGIIRDVGVAGLNPVTQINKINEIAAFISWQPKVEGSRKRTASALGSISRLLPDRFLLRLPPHPHMCVDQRVYLLTL